MGCHAFQVGWIMSRARRAFTQRHKWKWGALTGVLGAGTSLLQYIPQGWPVWVGVALTLLAFAATGISSVIGDDS